MSRICFYNQYRRTFLAGFKAALKLLSVTILRFNVSLVDSPGIGYQNGGSNESQLADLHIFSDPTNRSWEKDVVDVVSDGF